MTYRPPPVRQPFGVFLLVTNPRRRQAKAFLVAVAAALVAATAATADPSVSAKQAQAQQVLGQINTIDVQLGAAVEAYNTANVHLEKIQGDLRDNTFELGVARTNLKRSQVALSERLVSIYTSGDQNSTLAVRSSPACRSKGAKLGVKISSISATCAVHFWQSRRHGSMLDDKASLRIQRVNCVRIQHTFSDHDAGSGSATQSSGDW